MLTIYKHGRLNFEHIAPELNYDLFPSRFYVDILNDFFQIKESGGSLHYKIAWQSVIINDLTTSTVYTPSSKQNLINILVMIEYQGIVDPAVVTNNGQRIIFRKNDTLEINVTNAYMNANFDLSNPLAADYGYGINERVGWKIDFSKSERVSVGYDPTKYPTLGFKFGEEKHTMIKEEMFPHDHDSILFNNGQGIGNDLAIGPVKVNKIISYATTETRKTNKTSTEGGEIISGIRQARPFNIMQPSIVRLTIERLEDLVILNGTVYNISDIIDSDPTNTTVVGPNGGIYTPSGGSGSTTPTLWGTFKRIRKGYANTNPMTINDHEAGDIYEGGIDAANYSYCSVLKTTGASLTNEANFDHYLTVPIP